ncbi:MAG: class I SAM-dependent methyltransferase [Opitutaceae bacterium]
MQPSWNKRYEEAGFAYGTEPNDFLREHAHLLEGPVLSLAEGEGRNGVYLAGLGLDVTGVDSSDVGLNKARTLAQARGVSLRTVVADLATHELGHAGYGSVVAIYAHFPRAIRQAVHQRVREALRPGGMHLVEAYTPAQTTRPTGGPRDPELCYTLASLQEDFRGFEILIGREVERSVVEGRYHTGPASVVQWIARKPRDR